MARSRVFAGGFAVSVAIAGPAFGPAGAAETVRPASEAMRPCPKSGAGFVHVPGSDTCIRLSGRVAAGIDAGSARKVVRANPPDVARLAIDTRTDTDYGPVRAFVRIGSGHR